MVSAKKTFRRIISMELGLKGKHVIVTGGGSNIGRAIVHAFAAEGSDISIAELVPSQGEIVAGEVAAMNTGSRVTVIPADVTDPEKVALMVEQAIAVFGPVDVLVNNVGWTVDRLFMEKPRHEWEREVQVNLWGAINCIHAVLPGMIEQQAGAIVCISSDAGRMGEYREAVYSACKAGVIALSKSVARETGRYGLRLNVVCPGLVVPPDDESISGESMWTQMREIFTEEVRERVERNYLFRRMGTAQEVANAVVFLASDAASFITGQTLSVSGGYTMM
jgi:2-hydroxycyclohexanecarboxyl-CoA dehydrogenase